MNNVNLSDFISHNNLHKKTAAVVMGSAPSVSLASKISEEKVMIAVGDLPWRAPELGPYDFWITANNIFPIPWDDQHAHIIKKINIPTLVSCVAQSEVNMKNLNYQEKCKKINQVFNLPNVIPYDSVHQTTDLNEAKVIDSCLFNSNLNSGLSIQELLLKYSQSAKTTYSSGHTVAIHGFALAVLLNANPIYLSGIEIPRTMNKYRYINNLKRLNYSNETWMEYMKRMIKNYIARIGEGFSTDFSNMTYEKILEDFSIVTSIAIDLGIDVINLSSSSSLTKIKGIHTIEKI
jgi:hypothetical protein